MLYRDHEHIISCLKITLHLEGIKHLYKTKFTILYSYNL